MSERYNPHQIIAISDFARYIRTWSRQPAVVDWTVSYENNVVRLTKLAQNVSGNASEYIGPLKNRVNRYADPVKLQRALNAS